MKAEELVIRFWALSEGLGSYEKPLATFISNYAETNRNPSSKELDKLSTQITRAHERATRLFGDHCFTFSQGQSPKFNSAVFDAQMVACERLSDEALRRLCTKISAIRRAYEALQEDADFANNVTRATSDKAAIQGRIHTVSSLLKRLT